MGRVEAVGTAAVGWWRLGLAVATVALLTGCAQERSMVGPTDGEAASEQDPDAAGTGADAEPAPDVEARGGAIAFDVLSACPTPEEIEQVAGIAVTERPPPDTEQPMALRCDYPLVDIDTVELFLGFHAPEQRHLFEVEGELWETCTRERGCSTVGSDDPDDFAYDFFERHGPDAWSFSDVNSFEDQWILALLVMSRTDEGLCNLGFGGGVPVEAQLATLGDALAGLAATYCGVTDAAYPVLTDAA